MTINRQTLVRRAGILFAVLFVATLSVTLEAQEPYRKPPQAILDVLNAPETPQVSISSQQDLMILADSPGYASIGDHAQPMLRLAGLRIDPATNGPSRPRYYTGYTLTTIPDGVETAIDLEDGMKLSLPEWSPDGDRFAFTNTLPDGIELWVGDRSGTVRKVDGVAINAAYGTEVQWMPDGGSLLIQRVPSERGAPPEEARIPTGPNVQETSGPSGPVRTYQDLLEDAHDVQLFDYYATAQLAFVDFENGRVRDFGEPALFRTLRISPDGNHFLVSRVLKPYSYLYTHRSFPQSVEVWDRSARVEHTLARTPLEDRVPIGGVTTERRSYVWVPTRACYAHLGRST